MSDLLYNSVFLGVALSLVSYMIGMLLNKKFKLAIFNPLLISIIITILVLVVFNFDYESYNEGAKPLSISPAR